MSGHLPSGCSPCLTNAECQGKWDPDEAYDGTPHIGNRAVTVVAYATVRVWYIAAKTITHAFDSRHCDSNQFYSFHLMYIYIPRHVDGITLRDSNKGSLLDETRRNENDINEVDTNEDTVSRTSHDRLLSAAAGAAVTLAALWLGLITAAVVTVILRA